MSKALAIEAFYRQADFTQPENECWLWRGHIQTNGYGVIASGERYFVHVLSYELHKGPIPAGLEAQHLCDNRACYNWRHLLAGSHQQNMKHVWRWRAPKLRLPMSPLAEQIMANDKARGRTGKQSRKSTESSTLPQAALSDAAK